MDWLANQGEKTLARERVRKIKAANQGTSAGSVGQGTTSGAMLAASGAALVSLTALAPSLD